MAQAPTVHLVTGPPPRPDESGKLRERFIRETESLIDGLRTRQDDLLEEASHIDDQIRDARATLQLLKSRK
jgi:hypothetical protein